MPRTDSTTPVARFKMIGLVLFANLAATLAHKNVDRMQKAILHQSGAPPMAKWLTAPVNAVNVMINTLVPTAVHILARW